ncbi:T6SS effector BTH_I2691 family protein, partial [Caballeronia grimmiae]|uniref:T6SS effector BTH_I2691 family protein n=1 Tax=Caballeronia grimmiae TaxID=1071679 RepID=UPI0038B83005
PFEFKSRASTYDVLLEAVKSCGPAPGAVLMLNDPIAVASEIASRLTELRHEFMTKNDRERKLNASTAILGLQKATSDKSEYDSLDTRDWFDEDNHWSTDPTGRLRYDMKAATLPEVSKDELKTAANSSWNKYVVDYDEQARATWHKQFLADNDAYLKRTLLPLATAHAAWMKSSQMAHYFECTHDDASVDSGLVYVRMLTMCMQSTQEYEPCAKQYYEWISGSFFEPNNLVLRAILLNLKKSRDQIVQQVKPDIAWATIGWDSLFGGFNNLAGDALSKQADVLTRFVVALGGSITRLLQSGIEGPVRHGLVAIGMLTQRPVVEVELTGSYKTFRASLIRQLTEASGIRGLSENGMQREVTQALRRLTIHGEPMSKTVSAKTLVLIDEDTIKGMPRGLSKSAQAKWVATSLRTAEEIDALNLSRWRNRINIDIPAGTGKAAARAAKAFPIIGNLVAGFAQIATATSVLGTLQACSGIAALENGCRFLGAAVLLASTVADSAARVALALKETPLGMGRAATLEFVEHWGVLGGRWLGIGGAVMGVIWDGYEAYDAYARGDGDLAFAFAVSVVAGVGIAFAIAFTSVWLAIAAAVMYMFAQFRIASLGDDKIDMWLKKSIWGRDKINRFGNMELELKELQSVTGA